MDQQTTPPSLATLRRELSLLRDFVKTASYEAFLAEFRGEYENQNRKIHGFVPQTIGDFLEREQAIGNAGVLADLPDWFTSRIEALEQTILSVEPEENT